MTTAGETIPEPRAAPGDPGEPGPDAASATRAQPPRCPTRTRRWRDGVVVEEGFPAEVIAERLTAADGSFVWLDLFDPDEHDLAIVTEEFGLHPLAVEDAIQDHQRPKLDRYGTHLFVNMYATEFDEDAGALRTSEVSAFITPRALITVRKSRFDVDALVARWDAGGELTRFGVWFLVHGLLDAVVDGHDAAAGRITGELEALEDALDDSAARGEVRRRGFALRKALGTLRRCVAPMREVVGRLLRGDGEERQLPPGLRPYFEDVNDHVLQAADDVDASSDLVTGILDLNYNEQGNELNEITKRLAAWAAIIAVPTAVTGFYGQNVPYPGFSKEWGFATSSILIVVLAGGLYLLLRRRGWL